jgi:uncharacterized protein
MILLPTSVWEIKDTKKKGKGVFAKEKIKSKQLIAQYTGGIVPITEIDIDSYGDYLMHYDDEHAIVPDLSKPGAHVINHSCDPNCWVFPHEKNVFFASIRDIEKGEEITIHYLYHPLSEGCENCNHICTCESSLCTGTMHADEELHKWWQSFTS